MSTSAMTAGQLRDWLIRECHEWGDDMEIMLAIPVRVQAVEGSTVHVHRLAGILGGAELMDLRGERAGSDRRELGMMVHLGALSGVIGETVLVPRPHDQEDETG